MALRETKAAAEAPDLQLARGWKSAMEAWTRGVPSGVRECTDFALAMGASVEWTEEAFAIVPRSQPVVSMFGRKAARKNEAEPSHPPPPRKTFLPGRVSYLESIAHYPENPVTPILPDMLPELTVGRKSDRGERQPVMSPSGNLGDKMKMGIASVGEYPRASDIPCVECAQEGMHLTAHPVQHGPRAARASVAATHPVHPAAAAWSAPSDRGSAFEEQEWT